MEQTEQTVPNTAQSKIVPQTYGEAIQQYPFIDCKGHEWDNRTTFENAIYLIEQFQSYHTQRLQEIIGELEDIEEADGEMPDELWEDIKNDKESCTEVVRIAIRQTKEEAITLLQNHIDDE